MDRQRSSHVEIIVKVATLRNVTNSTKFLPHDFKPTLNQVTNFMNHEPRIP
jgi:hypothetical protein